MRRPLAIAALGAVLVLAGQAAAKPPPVPDRVLVRGSEFDLVLSKQRVHPGRVIIQFVNGGEDPHDLRLRRHGQDEDEELGLGEVVPGEYENLDTRLRKRSTYVLWCSLSGHRESGMEAKLRTKKRRLRG